MPSLLQRMTKMSIRGEALLGLAQRDRMIALPLLQSELQRNFVTLQALEAAAAVADVSLVESLRAFAEPSGDERLDELALEALAACEKGA